MRTAFVPLAVCLSITAFGRTHHRKTSGTAKAHASSSRRGRHSRTHTSHLHYQLTPTPERYTEIQQALAKKGYFKGNANGVWGSDSVDALRRFQADQKLDGDGKLTARSLGALGLGSKHAAVAQVTRPGGTPPGLASPSTHPTQANPPPATADPPQNTPSGSNPNDHRSPEGSQRP